MLILITFAFQVATNAKGRGVLRLLLLQQQIRLFSIPGLCMQLGILAYPSWQRLSFICVSYEVVTYVVTFHHLISSIAIASGRYGHD